MKKTSRTFLTIAVALVALFSLTAKTLNVSAYTYKKGADATIDKIVTNNAYIAASIFKDSITLLTLNDNGVKSILSNSDDCHVPMPNTIIRAKDGNSPRLSCYDFLVGKGDEWSGIMDFPTFEKDVTTYAQYAEYLEGFGYTKLKDEGWTKKCVFAQIEDASKSGSGPDTNKENTSEKICADVHGSSDRMKDVTQVSDSNKSTIEDYYLEIEQPRFHPDDDYNFRLRKHGNTIFNFYTKATAAGNPDLTWTEFIKKWEDGAKSVNSVQVTIKQSDESDSNASSTDTVDHNTVYEKGSDARIVDKILGTVTNLPLSTAEVYNIYNQYLNDQDNVNLKCSDTYDFKSDTNNKWYKVQIKRDGKIVDNCWAAEARPYSPIKYTGASKTPSSYDPITGQDSSANTYYFTRENMTLEEIINQINKFDLTAIEGDINDISNPSASSNDPSANKSSESDPCYNAGIEGMSWILCPVVNNTTNTVDSFESTLKALLSIDSNSLFKDGVAYNIWENFRNIANAILVIVFLVIIFSQLTGYGIDNYGIKKMLPKLIVMGVLINLSYIICELAVDLSNILGVGLNNLFESVASAANIDTSNAGSVVAIVLVVLGAAATTAASGYLTGGGAGIIVALVLALISALVALLIFLAMIGIRMIIVVVFTVISPVAFALYILPNTQNLFKKWWKVFEAALVVYPICGVLYGAHFIVKAILSGSSNIFMNIAAIIAPFLPFFALPSLLKSAMAGLGSVAGAITAAGTAFRRGTQSVTNTAKSAVEGSERYKNSMQDRARNRQIKMMDRGIDRLQNKRRPLTGNEELRLARMQQTQDKLRNEDRAARAIVEQNRTKDMDLSGLSKEWNDAWESGNKEKLDAMTSVINSRYGAAGANEIAKKIATKNIANDENSQSMMKVLQNNMNHDSTLANNMRNKASDAYGMISDGGKDRNGNYQNLSHFTDNNEIAKSDKDWSTQSSATLQRAVDSGRLTKDQIKRILNSSDTSIQSGLDDDKRKVLQGAVPEFTTPVQSTPITSGNAMADEAELNALLRQQRQNNKSGNNKRSPGGVILS